MCDDDKEILDAITIYLQNEGYQVFKATNGVEALAVVEDNETHLIIMDIMMPQMDGLRATMKLREENNIPVIMLSAKSEDTDKIIGLNMGADDYITKPFNPLELIARVKSQLRRYTTLGSMETKSNVFKTGGLVVDDESKLITVDGEEVKLKRGSKDYFSCNRVSIVSSLNILYVPGDNRTGSVVSIEKSKRI